MHQILKNILLFSFPSLVFLYFAVLKNKAYENVISIIRMGLAELFIQKIDIVLVSKHWQCGLSSYCC